MTIGIGALCERGRMVVCASDRMVTAGDVQCESPQTKAWELTGSISVLVAGDVSTHADVYQRVYGEVHRQIAADPDNWWEVRDVADLYAKHYSRARSKKAEATILAPLGLDFETWMARQAEMDPGLVRTIASELLNYRAADVEAIVAGCDDTGGHVYLVRNGEVDCRDGVGFGAVGIGAWHVSSQLMFSGHSRDTTFPDALLSAYWAKKRAEVAPGVGTGTDMVVFGPKLGMRWYVTDDMLEMLGVIYEAVRLKGEMARWEAVAQIHEYCIKWQKGLIPASQTLPAGE